MRRSLVGLTTGAALSAAIWLVSPTLTGQYEPWDASSAYFAVSLLAAGLLSGAIAGKWFWSAPFGVYLGQMAVMVLRPQPGATGSAPLWAGAILLAVHTLWAMAGAALAFGVPAVLDRVRRRRAQFSVRTLLLATAAIALVLGLALHLPVRFSWRFGQDHERLADVKALPIRPMPETPSPEGWVHCRFGPLQFHLPPELVKEMRATTKGAAPELCFYEDTDTALRRVLISLPTDVTAEFSSRLARDGFSQADSAVPPEGRGLSMIRLRLACCQASWDDFRWTMSPHDLRWHMWCVTMSRYLRSFGNDGRVETLFRHDLEGLVHFRDVHSWQGRLVGEASFRWQAKDGKAGADIHFTEHAAATDPAWMRAVCRSLKFSGEPFPECTSEDQVLALFEVVSE